MCTKLPKLNWSTVWLASTTGFAYILPDKAKTWSMVSIKRRFRNFCKKMRQSFFSDYFCNLFFTSFWKTKRITKAKAIKWSLSSLHHRFFCKKKVDSIKYLKNVTDLKKTFDEKQFTYRAYKLMASNR